MMPDWPQAKDATIASVFWRSP